MIFHNFLVILNNYFDIFGDYCPKIFNARSTLDLWFKVFLMFLCYQNVCYNIPEYLFFTKYFIWSQNIIFIIYYWIYNYFPFFCIFLSHTVDGVLGILHEEHTQTPCTVCKFAHFPRPSGYTFLWFSCSRL